MEVVIMGNKKVQEVVTSLFSSCQISSEVSFFIDPLMMINKNDDQ